MLAPLAPVVMLVMLGRLSRTGDLPVKAPDVVNHCRLGR